MVSINYPKNFNLNKVSMVIGQWLKVVEHGMKI